MLVIKTHNTMYKYCSFFVPFRVAFWGALAAYNRGRELKYLLRWASSKGYLQPLRLYRLRLQDEEIRIHRYALLHPRVVRMAYLVHILNTLLFPRQRDFRRGAASYYKRSFWTGIRITLKEL